MYACERPHPAHTLQCTRNGSTVGMRKGPQPLAAAVPTRTCGSRVRCLPRTQVQALDQLLLDAGRKLAELPPPSTTGGTGTGAARGAPAAHALLEQEAGGAVDAQAMQVG